MSVVNRNTRSKYFALVIMSLAFVKKARRDDEQPYTPHSLVQLLRGIQRFSSSKIYTTSKSACIHVLLEGGTIHMLTQE